MDRTMINLTNAVSDVVIQMICDTTKITLRSLLNLGKHCFVASPVLTTSSCSQLSLLSRPAVLESSLNWNEYGSDHKKMIENISIGELIHTLHIRFKLPLIEDVLKFPSSFYQKTGVQEALKELLTVIQLIHYNITNMESKINQHKSKWFSTYRTLDVNSEKMSLIQLSKSLDYMVAWFHQSIQLSICLKQYSFTNNWESNEAEKSTGFPKSLN